MIGSSLLCGEPSDRRVEVVSECRGDRCRLQRRAVRPEKFIVLARCHGKIAVHIPFHMGKNMLCCTDRRERPRRKPPLRERDGRPGLVKIPGDIRKLPQSREQPLGGTLAQGEPAVPHEQEHSPLLDPARFFRRAHGEHIGHAVLVRRAEGAGGAFFAQRRAVRQANRRAEIHHRLVPFAGTLAVDAFGEHGAKTLAHPGVHDVLRDAADPGGDAQEIAVHRRLRLAEGDGGDGARRIVADAGEAQKLLARVGKFPAAVVYENLRRTVQVPCAGVVAQTLPELEKPLLAHCRERVHVGQLCHKAGIVFPSTLLRM